MKRRENGKVGKMVSKERKGKQLGRRKGRKGNKGRRKDRKEGKEMGGGMGRLKANR